MRQSRPCYNGFQFAPGRFLLYSLGAPLDSSRRHQILQPGSRELVWGLCEFAPGQLLFLSFGAPFTPRHRTLWDGGSVGLGFLRAVTEAPSKRPRLRCSRRVPQIRNKKLHRSRPKLAQVENADCPAVVAAQFGCSFGELLFSLCFSRSADVSYISIPDHPVAFLTPRSPIQFICHWFIHAQR